MTINAEAFAAAAAIGLGLGKLLKSLGLNTRFIPLAVWVSTSVVYTAYIGWETQNVIAGLVAGVTASGLHSGVKNTFERKQQEEET